MKSNRIKSILIFIVLFVLLYLLIVLSLMFVKKMSFYIDGNKEYDDLSAKFISTSYSQTTDDEIPELPKPPQVDISSLKKINPDFVAWIYLGEDMSYPIAKGMDNVYYLKHSFERTYSPNGCIFLNSLNSADFSDQHSIIYGHNMRNGSMFAGLHRYKDEKYLNENPYFWIITENKIILYEIYYVGCVKDASLAYTFVFNSSFSLEDYLSYIKDFSLVLKSSQFNFKTDKLVSLSTCTNGSKYDRLFVQGKAIAEHNN